MRGIIASCPCSDGCPRCVESPTQFSQDAEPNKVAAIALLDMMLGKPGLNGAVARRNLPVRTAR